MKNINNKKIGKCCSCCKFDNKCIILCLVVLIAIFGIVYVAYSLFSQPSAEVGDTVKVDYIGKLENGTVFDTSLEEVALKSGLNRTEYSSLEFVVGDGSLISGFEDAIIGMKKGETKTVNLDPSSAYGNIKNELILNVPKVQKIDRYIILNASEFTTLFNSDAVVGKEFNASALSWSVKVITSNITEVKVENIMKVGDAIQMPSSSWSSIVTKIDETTIYLKQSPNVGDSFVIPNGYSIFTGVVTNVNDVNFTINMNHPLAGKNLIFEITLIELTKPIVEKNVSSNQTVSEVVAEESSSLAWLWILIILVIIILIIYALKLRRK
jgi:FKBP-type peptidyl-prolyl cis-trans isomerase 2